MPNMKKTDIDEKASFNFKTIATAFGKTEVDKISKLLEKRIYSGLDDNGKRISNKIKFLVTDQSTFYNVWFPNAYRKLVGNAPNANKKVRGKLSTAQLSNLYNGQRNLDVGDLKHELKNRSLQMFWEYKNYLAKVLSIHIMSVIYFKNYEKDRFETWKEIDSSLETVEKEIKSTWFDEYNGFLKEFKEAMLTNILTSSDFLHDRRIGKTPFYTIINKKERDVTERLTILSIFALLAGPRFDSEKDAIDFYDALYENIYDDKNVLKPYTEKNSNSGYEIEADSDLIWDAGKNWYEKTKNAGNRFFGMIPNHDIIPVTDDMGDNKPLLSKIEGSYDHLFLLGEGGVGKTTALFCIMENVYRDDMPNKDQQIPLFIELSKALDPEDFRKEQSFYIRNTVLGQVQELFGTDVSIETQLKDLFSKDTNSKEYIFLLDGLNEVSREKIHLIIAEIKYIIMNYKNVQIVLSGRNDSDIGKELTTLKLDGIKPDMVKKYLSDKNISQERMANIESDAQLMEILRIPLFLTMYAELDGNEEIKSRGEILHAFFSQTKKSKYSEKNRISIIKDEAINESAVFYDLDTIYCFILDFIMPTIAWNMVSKGEYHITKRKLHKLIKGVLNDKSPISWCGELGRVCFSEYVTDDKKNTRKVAKQFCKVYGEDEKDEEDKWDAVVSSVCECLTRQLGILENDCTDKTQVDGHGKFEYKVIHEHIRDYFAALYHINKLRLAVYMNEEGENELARQCLAELSDQILPGQVATFIGEACGEKHNVPQYDEQAREWKNVALTSNYDLITRGLDIYRCKDGKFAGNDGKAVWNLLQILKLVRSDLSGIDLSYLDLTDCHINGYRLGNKDFAASLKGAKLNESFFLASGHFEHINSATFSPTRDRILTCGNDRQAIVWSAETFEEIESLKGHTDHVNSARFDSAGNYAITASRDTKINIYDLTVRPYKCIDTLIGHTASVNYAEFSSDGKKTCSVSFDGSCRVWTKNSEQFEETRKLEGLGKVRNARFSSDGNRVIIACDSAVKIWDIKADRVLDTLEGDFKTVNTVQFNKNGDSIVAATDIGVKVWRKNNDKYEIVSEGELNGYRQVANSAQFSTEGKYIIVVFKDDRLTMVYDAKTLDRVFENGLGGGCHEFRYAEYSSDDKYIVTNTWRETRVWDAKTFMEVPGGVLQSHFSDIFSASYNSDGTRIVLACREGTAKVFDAATYKELPEGLLKGHVHSVYSAVYGKNDKYIILASGDGTAKIYSSETFREIPNGTLKGHKDRVHDAQFNSDGTLIATCGMDRTARLWRWNESDERYEEVTNGVFTGQHTKYLNTVAFSPDSKYLVTSSEDHTCCIYDLEKLEPVEGGVLICEERISSAVFDPDKVDPYRIMTADHTGKVTIWDPKTGEKLSGKELKDSPPRRCFATYSKDGSMIASASWNGYGIVYKRNEVTGKYEKICVLEGHTGEVSTARFSPDNQFVLTSSWDNTAIVHEWDSESGKYVAKHIIHSLPGIEVWNVDLTELNEGVVLQDEAKSKLSEYGAIV